MEGLIVTPEKGGKCLPPFTNLPSFMATQTILSFLDYRDQVYSLLKLLNRNSQFYLAYHSQFLDVNIVMASDEVLI